jgi:hypothetical protein
MGKAQQYRHYATECVRLAQQAQEPSEKHTLLSMASAWRRLAEHAEHAESMSVREQNGGFE